MSWFEMLAAVVVGVVSVARLTRLLTQDTYPPVAAIRDWWRRVTKDGPWSDLAECPFCAAPYFAAAVLAWGLLTDFQVAWWVVNGWLAASYLAAMVVVRDTPE
ncbi:MAG: hypothetical protein ACRDXB_09015 [Actinomycetes bacterium]